MKLIFKSIIFSLVILIIFTAVYYYAMCFGTKGLIINEHTIKSNTITDEYDGFKIVHLSDIHYGLGITKEQLINIVNQVNLTKPDICVITGDLINDNINDEEYIELVEVLSNIEATMGKYIIDGNHDYNYGKWENLVSEIGFINLNDSYDNIYNNQKSSIFLAGISNNTYSEKSLVEKTETIFNFLNNESFNKTFNILLMHEPDFIEDIDYTKFDLVLAGHSHNGQVRIPLIGAIYKPKFARKYFKPYYKLKETDFYVSSGIGTSELPIRLFNKPSFNFYRIIKNQD